MEEGLVGMDWEEEFKLEGSMFPFDESINALH